MFITATDALVYWIEIYTDMMIVDTVEIKESEGKL